MAAPLIPATKPRHQSWLDLLVSIAAGAVLTTGIWAQTRGAVEARRPTPPAGDTAVHPFHEIGVAS